MRFIKNKGNRKFRLPIFVDFIFSTRPESYCAKGLFFPPIYDQKLMHIKHIEPHKNQQD